MGIIWILQLHHNASNAYSLVKNALLPPIVMTAFRIISWTLQIALVATHHARNALEVGPLTAPHVKMNMHLYPRILHTVLLKIIVQQIAICV